jgi:hypothetical protein
MACRIPKGASPISGQGPIAMYFWARLHYLDNAQGVVPLMKKVMKN